MEKEDIIKFLKEPAHSNIEWVRNNPLEATRMIWWLMGTLGLRSQRRTNEGRTGRKEDGRRV